MFKRHAPLTEEQKAKVIELYNQNFGIATIGMRLRLPLSPIGAFIRDCGFKRERVAALRARMCKK